LQNPSSFGNKPPGAAFAPPRPPPAVNNGAVADSQRSSDPLCKHARAQIAKGGGLISISGTPFEQESLMSMEPPSLSPQPGMAERAIDTATDVSRTITDVTTTLRAAVDRLSDTIAAARQPGQPLSTITAITREAPLASLFVAFLFGVAVTRRR
jgi:hypothetical protein